MANDHIADDRKKARLIDANELKNNIMEAMMRQFEKNGDRIALRIAEMMCHFVDVTDTVDAVEVRCKDCEFCVYNSSNDTYKCRSINGMYRTVKPDDFCSYGERRTNEPEEPV